MREPTTELELAQAFQTRRVIETALALQQIAPLVTTALQILNRSERELDGHKTRTLSDGMPQGTSELTLVERAVEARWQVAAQRAQLLEDLETLEQQANAVIAVVYGSLRMHAPDLLAPPPKRCDGREFAGARLRWVPHSRAPENGWFDPLCADPADDSGLCPRCRIRERRWRTDHGMAPRLANAPMPAQQPQEATA